MSSTSEQPKKFLKKGEGLRRFAAYKPPLPTTTKKAERRQTFVRFRDDAKNASSNINNNNNIKNKNHSNNNNHREAIADFFPPELFDDSINLSTEVPKIAPPKIIHTPIRPNRHALGTLTYRQSDLATPTPGSGIAALDKQIKQIESNVNELRENLKKCECIAMAQSQAQATKTKKTTTTTTTTTATRRRPTTRAAARAAAKTNKESDSNNSTPQIVEERPSADADNQIINPLIPIEKLILDLAENVAQLRLKYDEEMEKRNDD